MQDFNSIPLIDKEISRELFTPDDDPNMQEMQAELWQGVRADLLKDLNHVREDFQAGNSEEACKNAHRIAGYAGSAGLKRVGVALRAIQHHEVPAEQIPQFLSQVEDWSSRGIREIEGLFPHLKQQ